MLCQPLLKLKTLSNVHNARSYSLCLQASFSVTDTIFCSGSLSTSSPCSSHPLVISFPGASRLSWEFEFLEMSFTENVTAVKSWIYSLQVTKPTNIVQQNCISLVDWTNPVLLMRRDLQQGRFDLYGWGKALPFMHLLPFSLLSFSPPHFPFLVFGAQLL